MKIKSMAAILLTAAILLLGGCDGVTGAFTTTTVETEPPDLRPEAPNFVGLTLEQVKMRYPSFNIKTEYRADEAEIDTVLEQDVPAGEKYDEGSLFTLTLSSGPKMTEIDDYVGRSIEDAQTLLEKQGFLCEIVREESDTVPENCVTRTSPAAREKALPGTTVTCYVSMGSSVTEIKVPKFIGLTVEEASRLAADNGIGLTIGYDDDPNAAPGTVLSQGIDEGTVVEPNTRVEIKIAGEASATAGKTTISVSLKSSIVGEFQLKYYIDGTLQEEKTEVKELSLTNKISWEVSGKDIHTYSIVVTSLETGNSGVLYEMEVDFTQDPPTKDHHGTFNENIFKELIS
ncbi:MAG: PASTA domain-containing protein [Bacteroides sp.]|nr:PASTA domain-containing protein [Eubacterium sp.]MCM1417518.1 PASTA domain-containing protein [Roseburia sp.]MCM1462553.1 PASTA domain-containing protein [Bacteroides sp.]